MIAMIAVSDNLPDVVRGSMAGSIVSNILLVLGAALVLGTDNAELDRSSLLGQLGLVLVAVLLLLIPSVPGWHGDPNRHFLALLSIGPAVVLLGLYLAVTITDLKRRPTHKVTDTTGWSLRTSLAVLGKMKLATEIAISSSAQVGLLVIPVVTLASFAFAHPLALAFRPIELVAMGAAALFVGFVIRDGRARRWEGALLIAVYGGFVVWFLSAGDR